MSKHLAAFARASALAVLATLAQPGTAAEDALAWKASEHELIEGRKREQLMDFEGARARYESAWAVLEKHKGWTSEWGSRVLWDLGSAVAFTCRDYDIAYQHLSMARAMALTGPLMDVGRQARILREMARVAYQGGKFRLAAEHFRSVRPLLQKALHDRSPLLLAEYDEEFALALRDAGEVDEAAEAAARAARIRAVTPPNPLMARPGPNLQQVCGVPRRS
jgi:tetratricopeptide (TPR) repeat protein